eukprot:TRINITY_DN12546_c0_g6_i1.p1 TRINITY_DN12546_c0_g6~~TRINITY_DN12546_c0_g6_i1.p1  ORF type:complete len:133 (-),score=40.00 TRINITY_DN12546_c0_g6_i1:160-558(-)
MCIRDRYQRRVHGIYNMNGIKITKLVGRLLAVACAIYLGVLGILRFDKGHTYSYYHVLGGIFFFLGLLILLAVIPVALMVKQFALLCQHIGLGGFLILTGLLVFDKDAKPELGCAVCLFSAGVANIVIGIVV